MAADLALLLRVQEENTAALKRIQADVANLGTSANNAAPSFLKLSSSFAVGQVAATAAIGAITGLANAFVGAVKGAVDLSASLEQTRIGLTSMLGSGSAANKMLGDLQSFAETTTFNFPALADGAKRMLAMGFAAKDIIPMLGDMGNAVGAVGGGTEVLNRVTLAFGQMQAKGKVSSEEMRQLAEAGIPVWELLAQAIGKTTEQTMKMVENREISSGTFFAAFHNFSQEKWGDMQAQQARTFTGAMSNVQDVIGRLAVSGFASLFSALTHGANLLFEFLKSDRVTQWAADFNASIGVVLNALRPLGDALKSVLGIGGGGGAAVAQAAAAPAQAITATVQAGAEASKEAIKGLDEEARGVTQTIHGINQQMTALNEQSAALKFKTEDTKKEFEAQLRPLKDVHDELQQAAIDAKEGFDRFLGPLKDRLEDTKRQVSDIKSSYSDQIDVVKDKIDALQGVNDTLRKEQDILADIEDLELRRKGLLAQGDPLKKAELQNKLDEIGFDKDHIANQIQLLTLHNKKGDNDREIAKLRKQQNELDAQAIGVREKLAGLVDRVATAEVKRAQAVQAVEKAEQAISRKREDLAVSQEVEPLQQQVKDLESQRDALVRPLEDQARGIQALYDTLQANQAAALAGIEAKQRDNERAIQDTERAQRAALEPLLEQADVLERQRSDLQLSAQHWQNIKQGISDSIAELKAKAEAEKEAGLTQGGGPKAGAHDKREILDPRDVGLNPPSFQIAKPMVSKEALESIRQAAIATGELAKSMETLGKQVAPVAKDMETLGKVLVLYAGLGVIATRLGQLAAGFRGLLNPASLARLAIAGVLLVVGEHLPQFQGALKTLGDDWNTFAAGQERNWNQFKQDWTIFWHDVGLTVGPEAVKWQDSLTSGWEGWLAQENTKWESYKENWRTFWDGLGKSASDALPEIGKSFETMGEAAFGWIPGAAEKIPGQMGAIYNALATWAEEQVQKGSALMIWMSNIGVSMLNNMAAGIGSAVEGFFTWLKENFIEKIPEWIRNVLQLQADTGAMAQVGARIIEEMEIGIKNRMPNLQALMEMAVKKLGAMGGDMSGGVNEWLAAAMSITGVGSDWARGLQQLLRRENAGGDPTIVNPEEVFVNGRSYGNASGLMQMLPSTFAAHALGDLRNIFDPIANAASSIRYIIDQYGHVNNIPGLYGGPYKGYGEGGVVPDTGLAMLHRNEMVLTPQRQRQLLSGSVGGGGVSIGQLIVQAPSSDPAALAEAFRTELIKIGRRNGYDVWGGLA